MKLEELILQLCGFEFNTEDGNNVMDQSVLNREVKVEVWQVSNEPEQMNITDVKFDNENDTIILEVGD